MDSGELLRAVERRLLRCPLPPSPFPPPPLPTPYPALENLLTLIERGDYAAALSSPAARFLSVFTLSFPVRDSVDSAAHFYGQLDHNIDSFLASVDDSGAEHRFALVLCVGVAALLAFVQQNITGPVREFDPCPLMFRGSDGAVYQEWDNWARWRFGTEAVGAHLVANVSLLQFVSGTAFSVQT